MKKNLLTVLILFLLYGCVGSSTSGVFGTGVSIALDPRTLGTQIDDSIMQKNLLARLLHLLSSTRAIGITSGNPPINSTRSNTFM